MFAYFVAYAITTGETIVYTNDVIRLDERITGTHGGVYELEYQESRHHPDADSVKVISLSLLDSP